MERLFTKPRLRVVSAFSINVAAGFFLLIFTAIQKPWLLTFDAGLNIVFMLLAIKIEEMLEK